MKLLLQNPKLLNVFTGEILEENVLLEDDTIVGIGSYGPQDADEVMDLQGLYLIPGLMDSHIHVESTTLTPYELAKAVLPLGTTGIVIDPHEIANVAGTKGIEWMLQASEGLPLDVYVMLPSCVPASRLEHSGYVLQAEDLEPFYDHPRVLGLAEMMNFPGVIQQDVQVMEKIRQAKGKKAIINGHAPLLYGRDLDAYIAAGIGDDHECSNMEEAIEKIRKGQMIMIREGTAARNLEALLGLFDEPYARRCLLATDDKHPEDLLEKGHINKIIAQAAAAGKDPIKGIQMATIQTAQYYGLSDRGAIAPGYKADLVVVEDLHTLDPRLVLKDGRLVYDQGRLISFEKPETDTALDAFLGSSMHIHPVSARDFHIPLEGIHHIRAIGLIPGELLTNEVVLPADFSRHNGADPNRDLAKLTLFERHHHTGEHFTGFIQGIPLKKGAIATSVGHDAHNLICLGIDSEDMALACNTVIDMQGGMAVVLDGEVLETVSLPIAGLISTGSVEEMAAAKHAMEKAKTRLGIPAEMEVFMTLSFMPLSVISHLKISTCGYVHPLTQQIAGLLAEDFES